MKAEQLIPSLETCKKLKRNDFPYSFFFWDRNKNTEADYLLYINNGGMLKEDVVLPAPTIAELLEVLPAHIWDVGDLTMIKVTENTYSTSYENENYRDYLRHHPNPAEALALLYIELKEKGAI